MRILIVNFFYYPDMVGGTETSVKLLAENLSKNNDVAIFCVSDHENLNGSQINGVKIYRTKCGFYKSQKFHKIGLLQKILNKIIEIDNLNIAEDYESVLNRFHPDIVHTNNLYGMSTVIWKITKLKGIPVVHTLRDYELLHPIKQLPHISSKLGKSRSLLVDMVTSPSKGTLEKFNRKKYFACSKKAVIPNAVKLNLKETNEIIKNRMDDNSNHIKFLFVGMLTEIKGVKNLLDAFFEVNNEDIELNICGCGDLEKYVKSFCNRDKRMHYLGQLSKEELKKIYIENDVVIVPSICEETFGRVVIEGNQYGLPVIGSNKGGIKEIIENTGTGYLFQWNSIESLKNAIIRFSNRKYIKSFYDCILKNIEIYSEDKQIDAFNKAYEEVLR